MRWHFNFLGGHVCILYIAYHVYSVIDPSGTNITGTRLRWACYLCLLFGSVPGCGFRALRGRFASFVSVQCIFLLLTRPLLVLLLVFELVVFMDWNLVFMGMWGHAVYVVWVQTYFWLYINTWWCTANFVVAGCRLFASVFILVGSLICFGFCLEMNWIC